MNKPSIIYGIIASILFCGPGFPDEFEIKPHPKAYNVSMIQLIANPDKYSGKIVIFNGFYVFGDLAFSRIYMSKDMALIGSLDDSVFIDPDLLLTYYNSLNTSADKSDQEVLNSYSSHYVLVTAELSDFEEESGMGLRVKELHRIVVLDGIEKRETVSEGTDSAEWIHVIIENVQICDGIIGGFIAAIHGHQCFIRSSMKNFSEVYRDVSDSKEKYVILSFEEISEDAAKAWLLWFVQNHEIPPSLFIRKPSVPVPPPPEQGGSRDR